MLVVVIDQLIHTIRRTWFTEIRFDIDSSVKPDIVGSMTDMSAIISGGFDAIYSSHNIEHLYAHEVDTASQNFSGF